MKVAELQGAQLDYWVALAEGALSCSFGHFSSWYLGSDAFPYSTEWSNGGPIIEREKIQWAMAGDDVRAWIMGRSKDTAMSGDSLLIASMRAYVASKYGDSVPDEGEAA